MEHLTNDIKFLKEHRSGIGSNEVYKFDYSILRRKGGSKAFVAKLLRCADRIEPIVYMTTFKCKRSGRKVDFPFSSYTEFIGTMDALSSLFDEHGDIIAIDGTAKVGYNNARFEYSAEENRLSIYARDEEDANNVISAIFGLECKLEFESVEENDAPKRNKALIYSINYCNNIGSTIMLIEEIARVLGEDSISINTVTTLTRRDDTFACVNPDELNVMCNICSQQKNYPGNVFDIKEATVVGKFNLQYVVVKVNFDTAKMRVEVSEENSDRVRKVLSRFE